MFGAGHGHLRHLDWLASAGWFHRSEHVHAH